MENEQLLPLISRVVHVATAIVLVGGSVFMRFALMPAAEELGQAEHDGLRERVLGRWRRVVHGGIALLLLSGLYNYLAVMRPAHQGDGPYHMLVGIKMLIRQRERFNLATLLTRTVRHYYRYQIPCPRHWGQQTKERCFIQTVTGCGCLQFLGPRLHFYIHSGYRNRTTTLVNKAADNQGTHFFGWDGRQLYCYLTRNLRS